MKRRLSDIALIVLASMVVGVSWWLLGQPVLAIQGTGFYCSRSAP